MNIYISEFGGRQFLVFEKICTIPVDTIEYIDLDVIYLDAIDLDAANGGCDNTVRLDTSNGEKHFFAEAEADALRNFLASHRITPTKGLT